MNTETALRFARQIQLGDVGPEGQARIGAARVVVAGGNTTAEIAAMYLRAAGVGSVVELRDLADDGPGWLAALTGADVAVRADFDEGAMLTATLSGATARLGLPTVAANPGGAGADAVVAGTLAAAEVLQVLLRPETSRAFGRELHLPASGGDPILQRMGARGGE